MQEITDRYLDLDAALGEYEPLVVHFNGRNYELPKAAPAALVLRYMNDFTASGITLAKVGPFMRDFVGEENFEDMLTRGLTFIQMEKMLRWALVQYGVLAEAPEEGEGDDSAAVDPTKPQSTSDGSGDA